MTKNFFKRLALTAMLVTTITLATGLAACSGTKERITISGSSSVSPVMQKLAQAYEASNKKIEIIISTSDSTIGIADAATGKSDIGMASRALKANETTVSATKICDDGVVLVVGKNNPLSNVTADEVYNIYANGTAIGATTAALSREEGSGTRDAFDGLIKNSSGQKLSELQQFSAIVGIQNNTGAVMSEIAGKDNLLGYISLGSLNNTVKALSYNGIAASAQNIKAGSYALARPFHIVTRLGQTLNPEAQKFISFILSKAGQAVLAQNGYVAL